MTDSVAGRRRRSRSRQVLRLLGGLLLLGGFSAAVARQWPRVGGHWHELSWPALVLCQVFALASVLATMLLWRALLAGLGSPLHLRPAARIYYVGQLGKYLPGNIWPLVVQMELGRDAALPRSRVALSGLLSIGLSVLTGSMLAVAALPWLDRAAPWGRAGGWAWAGRWVWAGPVVAAAVLLVCWDARPFNRAVAFGLALARRRERPAMPSSALRQALLWSLAAWLLLGMQVYLLAHQLGARGGRALPLAVGGTAAAVVVGILVVVAPAGAGAREAALVLTLAPLLAPSAAALVAIISRLQLAACDLLLAGAAVASVRLAGPPGPPAPGGPLPAARLPESGK